MDVLPTEIKLMISSFSSEDRSTCIRLSSTSHLWRNLLAPVVFERLILKAYQLKTDDALQALLGVHGKSVRSIHLDLMLEGIEVDNTCKRVEAHTTCSDAVAAVLDLTPCLSEFHIDASNGRPLVVRHITHTAYSSLLTSIASKQHLKHLRYTQHPVFTDTWFASGLLTACGSRLEVLDLQVDFTPVGQHQGIQSLNTLAVAFCTCQNLRVLTLSLDHPTWSRFRLPDRSPKFEMLETLCLLGGRPAPLIAIPNFAHFLSAHHDTLRSLTMDSIDFLDTQAVGPSTIPLGLRKLTSLRLIHCELSPNILETFGYLPNLQCFDVAFIRASAFAQLLDLIQIDQPEDQLKYPSLQKLNISLSSRDHRNSVSTIRDAERAALDGLTLRCAPRGIVFTHEL